MQLYPSWRYAPALPGEQVTRALIVENEDEDKNLGEGWYDSPAKFPTEVPAETPKAVKRAKAEPKA